MRSLLFHPWRWHRTPRSLPVNLARAALEAVLLAAVLVMLASLPSPVARVALAACCGAMSAAAVVTMRLERRAGS